MHKIALTGATGFVGRNIVEKLLQTQVENFEITLIVRDVEKARNLFEDSSRLKYIDINEADYKLQIKRFNPKTVIHLASYLTSDDSEKSLENILDVNINFGTNLLNALEDTDIKNFINFGTFAEYCQNDDTFDSAYLYSATKTAYRSIIKYYQKKMNFKWFNVVPYTIYGGIDSQKKVIDFIINSIGLDEPIKMTKGEQILDFIHVYDVVDFTIMLLNNLETINEEFVEFKLGTGVGTSVRDLAEIIESVFKSDTNILWGGLEYRPMDIMQAVADTSNCIKYLEFKPKISLHEGVTMIKKETYNI